MYHHNMGKRDHQQNTRKPRPEKNNKDSIPRELLELENPDFKKIMVTGGIAENFANSKQMRGLKSNQLRKFFDKIKNIENKIEGDKSWDNVEKTELPLLDPMIKYNENRGLIPKEFSKYMRESIKTIISSSKDSVTKRKMFKNFVRILEAIVAYHKTLGGA